MRKVLIVLMVMSLSTVSFAFGSEAVCLGDNFDSLIESMQQNYCKKGDIIATKIPGMFCDFEEQIVMNSYNSAYCVYNGNPKSFRTSKGLRSLSDLQNQNK